MKTWGLSFGSHDAALSVIIDEELVFASHAERFSKIKDDGDINSSIIGYAIDKYGKPDKIFFYENHWKKRLRYLLSGQFSNVFEPTPESNLRKHGISTRIVSIDHHHSHASAGFYTSGFSDAVVVVVDAIGEMETLTIWSGTGSDLKQMYSQNYPHSLGLFYSAMTDAAGFKPNGEEYIFMGMAAYGNESQFSDLIEGLVFDDSNRYLVALKRNLHQGASWLVDGVSPEDLAAATQMIYEKYLRKVLDWAYKNSNSKNLVLMGGCALNCVANSKIRGWHDWKDVWIMPNPGDAGSSLGAALAGMKLHIKWPGPYLGYDITGEYPVRNLLEHIKSSGIAAIANGRAEFGPRALGNRSILADPRIPDIKTRMNWLKKREQFRPFAAVIPEEMAPTYFEMENGIKSSPYMQYVFKCKTPDIFPGISHVDGTSRIQTVNKSQHSGLYELLMQWYKDTGCPMLINTSLNIKNQPLVNDEADAKEFQEKYAVPVFK